MDCTPPSAEQNTPAATSSRRRGGGQKRKSTSLNSAANHSNSTASQTTSSKRQAREKPNAIPFPPIHANGPCTRARVQPNHAAESREAAIKPGALGDHVVADDVDAIGEDLEALEAEIEAEYDKIKSRDKGVHVVPVHAGWFSWMKIHPLEEKMLPSFFNGKSECSTPEIYLDIRNWIIKKFHRNPSTHIELKDLYELAVGDVDGRQEVMEFLDYWGLINYHPFPSNEPSVMDIDAIANDESKKKDSLVDKLFRFESIKPCTPEVPKVTVETLSMSSGLFPESVVVEELVKAEGPSVDYHCNSCSADCSRKRYHCQKQADYDLCADCFNNGKFGSDMSPSDFILMEPGEGVGLSGGNWTDQETFLLLEAIEIFRDNWSEIAEHVATKTKAQCILHFVQMPIEDAFSNLDDENDVPKENSSSKTDRDKDTALEDVPEKTESHGGSMDNLISSGPLDPEKRSMGEENLAIKALKEAFEAVGCLPSPGEKISFAETDNPVMVMAAFIARLVDPNASIASLRSIMKSLSGNFPGEQLAARHCFHLEDPPYDRTDLSVSEEAGSDKIGCGIREKKHKHVEKQRGGGIDSVDDGIILLNNENTSNKDTASREHDGKVDPTYKNQKHGSSPNINPEAELDVVEEGDRLGRNDETQQSVASKPKNSDLPEAQAIKDTDAISASSLTEPKTNSTKVSDVASAGKPSQSCELVKDEDISSTSDNKEPRSLMTSSSAAEEEQNEVHKEDKEFSSEKNDPLVNNSDIDISKLKRAAVATLSAAAVKAKILAEQEEDQILHLSTFLIEKQVYKLEMKLALFPDAENIKLRVKEQLDRSKQRLFQERTALMAWRLGNRPPTNSGPDRAAVSHPVALKPPFMGMNPSLRPPISRPLMTQNSTSSSNKFDANCR